MVQSRTVLTNRTGRVLVTPRSVLPMDWSATSWNLVLEDDDRDIGLDGVDWLGNTADNRGGEDEIPKPPPAAKVKKTRKHWVSRKPM